MSTKLKLKTSGYNTFWDIALAKLQSTILKKKGNNSKKFHMIFSSPEPKAHKVSL